MTKNVKASFLSVLYNILLYLFNYLFGYFLFVSSNTIFCFCCAFSFVHLKEKRTPGANQFEQERKKRKENMAFICELRPGRSVIKRDYE